jgi:hypothetical protein
MTANDALPPTALALRALPAARVTVGSSRIYFGTITHDRSRHPSVRPREK